MLTVLQSDGPILVVEATGKLDGDDVDRAIAAYEEVLAKAAGGKVSALAIMRDVTGMTAEGFLKDLRYSLPRFRELWRFHRAAVVTDNAWLRNIAKVEDLVLPKVEIRTFPLDEEAAARAWVGLPPEPPAGI
ncbi:STAS/SEC14 domain-containing protein [Consotaella aegiceratis]|uniref:STAS/SEC14 domain-containing protein n=1 Tax=Consotaella aegiceratis TaxID=3097961 RepID=UPI002F3F4F12